MNKPLKPSERAKASEDDASVADATSAPTDRGDGWQHIGDLARKIVENAGSK